MRTNRTLVVVGAGLAGAKAAEGARLAGFDGRILLAGEEASLPYERPPLSKAVLRGEAEPESAHVHPEAFYADHDIELVPDAVTALHPAARRVELAGGGGVTFDAAVLATGSAPRRLTVPGADLDGVHYLRTLEDALRLRSAIGAAGRVAVVGAGWIGAEVAASARQMGAEVVMVDPAPVPLYRVLGEEIGGVFAGLHADHGVELRLGVGVTALEGAGRVERLVLNDGSTLEADLVVAGIGVIPRTELAEAAAGIMVDNGIAVDDHLRTSVDGIYAAGDVANAWHPHYRRYLRVEHWANALNQGLLAGANAALSGPGEVYDRLPYFFSDQYNLGMEYVGHADPSDAVVIRGSLPDRRFIAFWHRDGAVTAAMNVNVWDVVDDLKALISSGRLVDVARLGDPDLPFASLHLEAAGT